MMGNSANKAAHILPESCFCAGLCARIIKLIFSCLYNPKTIQRPVAALRIRRNPSGPSGAEYHRVLTFGSTDNRTDRPGSSKGSTCSTACVLTDLLYHRQSTTQAHLIISRADGSDLHPEQYPAAQPQLLARRGYSDDIHIAFNDNYRQAAPRYCSGSAPAI